MINRRRHQSLIHFLRVGNVLIVPKQVVVVVAVADVVSNRSNFYGRSMEVINFRGKLSLIQSEDCINWSKASCMEDNRGSDQQSDPISWQGQ